MQQVRDRHQSRFVLLLLFPEVCAEPQILSDFVGFASHFYFSRPGFAARAPSLYAIPDAGTSAACLYLSIGMTHRPRVTYAGQSGGIQIGTRQMSPWQSARRSPALWRPHLVRQSAFRVVRSSLLSA